MSENQKKQIESKPKKISIFSNTDDLKIKYCKSLEKEMEQLKFDYSKSFEIWKKNGSPREQIDACGFLDYECYCSPIIKKHYLLKNLEKTEMELNKNLDYQNKNCDKNYDFVNGSGSFVGTGGCCIM